MVKYMKKLLLTFTICFFVFLNSKIPHLLRSRQKAAKLKIPKFSFLNDTPNSSQADIKSSISSI